MSGRHSDATATEPESEAGWSKARLLRFPERPVGNLLALNGYSGSEFVAVAHGDVAIEGGTRVSLALEDTGLDVWSAIADLAPGDIQGLWTAGSPAGANQLPVTRYFAHFNELEELSLGGASIDLGVIAAMTSLRMLAIGGCRIEDGSTGSVLARLERLEELGFHDTPFNWRGFVPPQTLRVLEVPDAELDEDMARDLERCSSLERVYLSGCSINRWQFLAKLPKLLVLNLANVALRDDDFKLHKSSPVRFVNLEGTAITSASSSTLAERTELSSLILGSTDIDDAGIEVIANGMPQLFSLEIPRTQATPACLPSLAKLKELSSLDITGLGASARQLACLNRLEELDDLNLSENPCGDDLAEAIPGLIGRLRKAHLRLTGVGSRTINALGKSMSLTTLDITDCPVDDLRPILTKAYIQHLRAANVPLRAMTNLSWCTRLETLVLSGVDTLPSHELRQLRGLRAIRNLELDRTRADDACLDGVFRELSQLERLDLAHTHITDATLQQLTDHPMLRRLRLTGANVTSAGVGALAHCRHLEHLDLRATAIDDDAIIALVDGARADVAPVSTEVGSTTGLVHLDLVGTGVTAPGLLYLAHHPHLRRVLVDADRIEDLPERHRGGIDGTSIRWHPVERAGAAYADRTRGDCSSSVPEGTSPVDPPAEHRYRVVLPPSNSGFKESEGTHDGPHGRAEELDRSSREVESTVTPAEQIRRTPGHKKQGGLAPAVDLSPSRRRRQHDPSSLVLDYLAWFLLAPAAVVALALWGEGEAAQRAYEGPITALLSAWLLLAIGTWLLRRPYSWRALGKWRWVVIALVVLMMISTSGGDATWA